MGACRYCLLYDGASLLDPDPGFDPGHRGLIIDSRCPRPRVPRESSSPTHHPGEFMPVEPLKPGLRLDHRHVATAVVGDVDVAGFRTGGTDHQTGRSKFAFNTATVRAEPSCCGCPTRVYQLDTTVVDQRPSLHRLTPIKTKAAPA